jgi:endogenous inhibitor of DNA gyrase (YacG/DUF329 family)
MKPIDCPSCKQRVQPESKTFPFCSERCRLIDLGNWLGGRYRVAGEAAKDDEGDDRERHDRDDTN